MEQDRADGITPANFPKGQNKDIPPVISRRMLAAASGVALLAALSGCNEPKGGPTDSATETAIEATGTEVAGPDAKPGIAASEGRMVLPVVAGRPAAVYFTVRNDGPSPVTLAGIHVAGAGKAQMHKTDGGSMTAIDTLDIAPGATIEFAPGGMHVMAFDISSTLKAGKDTELTLTFADGDKLSMPLRLSTMGGDMDHDMAGHDMSGHDMGAMQH